MGPIALTHIPYNTSNGESRQHFQLFSNSDAILFIQAGELLMMTPYETPWSVSNHHYIPGPNPWQSHTSGI